MTTDKLCCETCGKWYPWLPDATGTRVKLHDLATELLDAFVGYESSSRHGRYWTVKKDHKLEKLALELMSAVNTTGRPDPFLHEFVADSLRKIAKNPDVSIDQIRALIEPDDEYRLLEWLGSSVTNARYVDHFRSLNPDPSRHIMCDIEGGQLI